MQPKFDPRHTALLIIDMQNDYCKPDGFYSETGYFSKDAYDKAIPKIRLLLDEARGKGILCVFTAVSYPRNIPDLADIHSLIPDHFRGLKRRLVKGTHGAEIIEELQPANDDYVIEKIRYSAFYGTELEPILRSNAIRTIIFTGAVSYVCVQHTAWDAFIRDFDVVVCEDGVVGLDQSLHEAALRSFRKYVGVVIPADEIKRMM